MRFSDPGYDTREPLTADEYERERDPEPEQIFPPCDLCGQDGIGADDIHGGLFGERQLIL